MKTWITSDTHWGHKNIMSFCPVSRARFNNDVDYMNEKMVSEWNEKVSPEDLVYILGDVAFLPAQKATEYMRRLNGQKILIEGNHDTKLLNDPKFRKEFVEVHSYLRLNYNGKLVILSHFPFLEWDQMHRGSLHFHGHLHGGKTNQEHYRCRDMGMDATGEIVMLMEDAIASIANNEIKRHH
jgi:calcineurin-like phosphoesterase family protein